MPRLFTGIEIPDELRRRLSFLRGGLQGARWIDAENYHLTLRFVGDIDNPQAREWFGAQASGFTNFEWHEDVFTIPPGGTRILTGSHCPNQAYVVDGRHLGMQCHVEVTAEMIETWCRIGISDIDQNVGLSPAVQDALTITTGIPKHLPQLTATATRLYARWIRNLR